MSTKRLSILAVITITLVILSFTWMDSAQAPQHLPHAGVTLKGPDGTMRRLNVAVADDNEERSHGLMGRAHLPEGDGMVFVFDEPAVLSFWMKNTLIPLDILYFDAAGTFVSRTTMSPCTTPDCPVYPSAQPAAFALEINAGEPLTAAVGEGWTMSIE